MTATAYRIRKYYSTIETILHDGGRDAARPLSVGVCAAVVSNPFAGRPGSDLMAFMESLKPLGIDLAQRILALLQVPASGIEAFGKGSMVGASGELEHAATWHAPGGAAVKEVLGARGFVSAGKTMGTVGTRLQIPLVHINSPWVRSHFNTTEIGIWDAPRPDELVFALAMATGGRSDARLGGVTVADVEAGRAPKV